jgi:2,3-bisphosphoglycerate-independent phosphoglycerate mutase
MKKRQVILVILDGWGIGPQNESNPIYVQGTPNINKIKENFLSGALRTSGISIGLPFGIQGNTEGHQTLGAGRIIYQHFPRITLAIRDGSFVKNRLFLDAFEHAKKNKGALNLAGLLTEGTIHASLQHLIALIKIAKQNGVEKINLHLFSDGKDSDPEAALRLIGSLLYEVGSDEITGIGSLSGRYFALDREKHWDRTQKVYQAMTGEGPVSENTEELLRKNYKNGTTDYYIEPQVINSDRKIKDGDALIFFNFREDSIRQVVSPFALPEFNEFPLKEFKNLYVGTMTSYSEKFSLPIAFPPEKPENPLGKVLADNGKLQVRITETQKYAHLTYFFNGFRQEPFKNEFRIFVPSQNIIDYSEKPAMQAKEITTRIIQAIEDQAFDFILVNYPNGDMVAHSGNFEAAKEAVKVIDEEIGKLTNIVLDNDAVLIITSDHGNIELLRDPVTGKNTTTHDPSPVPIYIVGKKYANPKSAEESEKSETKTVGTQADVAPTVLEILGLPKPQEMTGISLLKILK